MSEIAVGEGGLVPLSEGETQILLKLADNSLAQTQLANNQMLLLQKLVQLMEQLEGRIDTLEASTKKHVTTEMTNWRANTRLALFLIVVLVAIVEVVDVSIKKWIDLAH